MYTRGQRTTTDNFRSTACNTSSALDRTLKTEQNYNPIYKTTLY